MNGFFTASLLLNLILVMVIINQSEKIRALKRSYSGIMEKLIEIYKLLGKDLAKDLNKKLFGG